MLARLGRTSRVAAQRVRCGQKVAKNEHKLRSFASGALFHPHSIPELLFVNISPLSYSIG
jgi:hypothetical protein